MGGVWNNTNSLCLCISVVQKTMPSERQAVVVGFAAATAFFFNHRDTETQSAIWKFIAFRPTSTFRFGHIILRITLLLLLLFFPVVLFAEGPGPAAQQPARPHVRTIEVEIREIFDEPDIGFFYRTVNKVKISTREEIVRQELLVHEGDVFDQFLIDESERNLRSLPFLREVSITPVFEADAVDLIVSVQDTWTFFPFINLTSGGGTNKSAVGIAESDLLGYGKRIEFLVAEDEGRRKVEGIWDDSRFLGTYQRLTLGHFQRSDGDRTVVSYGRPFRSLVEPYSWQMEGDQFDLVGKLFENAQESFIYRQSHLALNGGFTFSRGDPEVLLRRYTLGYDFLSDEFKQAEIKDFNEANVDPRTVSHDPGLLAEDRRYSGPYVAYQQIQPDFLSINYVDSFDRIEDFNLGNELRASVGIAPQVLESIDNSLLFSATDSDGTRISPTSFLRGNVGLSARADKHDLSQALLNGQLKYIDVLGARHLGDLYLGKHTLLAALTVDVGQNLDRDFQFLLGAANGLRGYLDRTFSGDQRLILTLEDRFHLFEDVFRLVSIGGAFFVDAGGAGDNGLGDIVTDEFYGDFGFGLRFGLPRSSGGTVVRIDCAFPWRDGPDGSNHLEPRDRKSTRLNSSH